MGRRMTTVLVAVVLGGGALVTALAAPAAAADLDCEDFASQAAAQAHLRADPSDPDGLDGNDDGLACQSLPAPFDFEPVGPVSDDTGGVTSSGSASVSTSGSASGTSSSSSASSSSGPNDQDCGDFGSQAAAQAHLDADRSDPDNLDADNDGQACEGTFRTAAAAGPSRAAVVPAVQRSTAGAGQLARSGPPGTVPLVLTGTSLIVVGLALVRSSRRRRVPEPVWVVLSRL